MKLLAIVCAATGAWLFLGGIASFVAPSDAVPSSATNVVFGGVLLLAARELWRRGRRRNNALSFVLLPQAGLPTADSFQQAWNELTKELRRPRLGRGDPRPSTSRSQKAPSQSA